MNKDIEENFLNYYLNLPELRENYSKSRKASQTTRKYLSYEEDELNEMSLKRLKVIESHLRMISHSRIHGSLDSSY